MKGRFYSVPELMKILPVSSAALYKWINEDQIPAILIGTKRLVPGWWVDTLFTEPTEEEVKKYSSFKMAPPESVGKLIRLERK